MLHISLEGLQKTVEQTVKVYTTCHKQNMDIHAEERFMLIFFLKAFNPYVSLVTCFNHCVGKQIHTCKT